MSLTTAAFSPDVYEALVLIIDIINVYIVKKFIQGLSDMQEMKRLLKGASIFSRYLIRGSFGKGSEKRC
jgi:hypothetical protein